jgi:nitrite reductase (NADH) large subunit
MHVIENFFFTAINAANILRVTSSLSLQLMGVRQTNGVRLPPKTCSPLRAPSPAFKNKDALNGNQCLGMNESRCEHLVFAGNGMSGVACVEELLKSGHAFDITIFGDEPHTNYDRTLLPSVLAGERDAENITLNDIEWYQEHGIRTRLGIRVEEIDRLGRAVRSSDGDWTNYDRLILAVGSAPVIPAVEGLDQDGVFVFSGLDDTRRMIEAASEGAGAVVIGGWLAAEAARGLRKRGCDVTIIESAGSPERQLDSIVGNGRVEAVRFRNGEQIAANLVVIATNLHPNTLLARAAGLEVNRGIVVNDYMETSDRYIYALGGCVEHAGQTFECFPPILEQAKVLAANLAGLRDHGFADLDTVFQDLAASPLHHRAE